MENRRMRPATLEPATFSFTLAQLEAITAWATECPLGLCVRLMSNFDETEEVAEVFRPGGTPPLWFITSEGQGSVVLTACNGRRRNYQALELALAHIMKAEGN